jgi:hypothetical protein
VTSITFLSIAHGCRIAVAPQIHAEPWEMRLDTDAIAGTHPHADQGATVSRLTFPHRRIVREAGESLTAFRCWRLFLALSLDEIFRCNPRILR